VFFAWYDCGIACC